MANRKDFILKESIDDLKSMRKQEKKERLRTRLLYLILKDDRRFKTVDDLAYYLNISVWTLRSWRRIYQESGLHKLLTISVGGKRREVVTVDIHKGLEQKLNSSESPLFGYVDAVQWVKKTYGVTLKYHTLRAYMKRHFGSKLKIPRKSPDAASMSTLLPLNFF